MSDFFAQYKRPEWQRKRLEVMEDRDFTCEQCGTTEKTLNVHHTFYLKNRKPWEYPSESLRCLCEECHQLRHAHADELKLLLGELGQADFERVLGYVKGLLLQDRASPEDDARFQVRSWEEAYGMSEAYSFSTNADRVLGAAEASRYTIGHQEMLSIHNPQLRGAGK